MPRIAVCTNYEDRDTPRFSGENEHYDFCKACYPHVDDEQLAEADGVPVEAVSEDCEHPPYEYEDYECHHCGRTLTARDN